MPGGVDLRSRSVHFIDLRRDGGRRFSVVTMWMALDVGF